MLHLLGINMAGPDVCLTPIPSSVGPVPTPMRCSDIAVTATAIPSAVNVLALAMANHNMMTITPMSNGDNAGLMMNPLSGMVMGPQKQLLGRVKIFMGGSPANEMLGLSSQNGMMPGAFGETLSPSQVKVMFLS